MPSVLPVLPIRDAVVFPLTIAPVFLEQDRCRQLIEDVAKGDRLVAIVAQREADGVARRRPRTSTRSARRRCSTT